MTTRLNPYLSFRDTAREAMDFYRSVFGGELRRSTFAEFNVSDDPDEQDKIMHSVLTTDGGMVLMAADTPNRVDYTPGSNFSLALSGDDEDELRRCWDKLLAGGTVVMPLGPSPWGDTFGMCVDAFGVSWLVSIPGPAPE